MPPKKKQKSAKQIEKEENEKRLSQEWKQKKFHPAKGKSHSEALLHINELNKTKVKIKKKKTNMLKKLLVHSRFISLVF